MEFVRLKYANNKLINADIKEHRDVINEYILAEHSDMEAGFPEVGHYVCFKL